MRLIWNTSIASRVKMKLNLADENSYAKFKKHMRDFLTNG